MFHKLLHTDSKDIAATVLRIALGIVILPHGALSGVDVSFGSWTLVNPFPFDLIGWETAFLYGR